MVNEIGRFESLVAVCNHYSFLQQNIAKQKVSEEACQSESSRLSHKHYTYMELILL